MSDSSVNPTKLSTWAQNITPSPTLAITAKAKALKAQGEDICSFGAGEPDFDTPQFIKDACIKALQDGKTKYLPAAGLSELRQALAQKYKNKNGIEGATENEVIVSPGGKYSCYLALLATCQPGDEVIIQTPYWVSYPEMVKLTGATPVYINTTDDTGFKVTPEQLKSAITPATKLFILNSPSNPTGAIYNKKEIEALVEVALVNNILILSDEIYEYLIYDGEEHISPASLSKEAAQSIITVDGFSKTYSMTGWRLGSLLAPQPIAKAIISLQSHTTSNATTFAQYGALEAIENKEAAEAALKEMLEAFNRRRKMLHEGLNSIKGIQSIEPKGAFYCFPNISSFGLSSNEFSTRLLESMKVAVVPGIGFGADDYIRLSYATSDKIIQEGLRRLKSFCESL